MAVATAAGGIDTHRVRGIALPRGIAVGEARVRASVTKPAPEHLRLASEFAAVPKVGGDCAPRSAGMSAPVVRPMLGGVDEAGPVAHGLTEDDPQPRSEDARIERRIVAGEI